MAGGRPGDVEPAGAGQQLVGIGAGVEKVHHVLELARFRCVLFLSWEHLNLLNYR